MAPGATVVSVVALDRGHAGHRGAGVGRHRRATGEVARRGQLGRRRRRADLLALGQQCERDDVAVLRVVVGDRSGLRLAVQLPAHRRRLVTALVAGLVRLAVPDLERVLARLPAAELEVEADRRVLARRARQERVDVDQAVAVGVDPLGVFERRCVGQPLAAHVDADRGVPVILVHERRRVGARGPVQRDHHDARDDDDGREDVPAEVAA